MSFKKETDKLFNDVLKGLNKGKLNINKNRAHGFLKFTKTQLRANALGLAANKGNYATRKFKVVGHVIPMIYSKVMINHMANRVNRKDKSVESGYYADDSRKHPDSKLTIFQVAVINNSGSGVTPPRPFIGNSAHRFNKELDNKIISKEVDKILKKAWA